MSVVRQLAQTTPGTQSDPGFTPSSGFLDSVNPLKVAGTDQELANQLSTPGGIVSRILLFAIPLAGVILFAMILWGGFDIISGAAGKKGIEEGRKKITTALIGFFILFSSYWIVQILQTIFGFQIL